MNSRNMHWQQSQASSRKKGLAHYKIIPEVESSPHQLFKARRIVDRLFCIIKRIDLSSLTEEEKLLSFNEVKVLASLKCQYIVTCYDSFTEGNSLYVVVEYTHMGSLKKKLIHQRGKLLSERAIWKYFLQIAAAVLNMNQNSILHGSLQLQSIFLNSKDDVRLSNFGRAIRLSNTSNRNRRKKGITYNTKTEMLSLGHLLYELCTLRSIHENTQQGAPGVSGANHRTSGKVSYSDLQPLSQHYSPELESLVKDLLSSDPTQRPSIQEIWTSPLVRNKALTSNVQMPKVFFPQLQVLNEMKNKYNISRRHWTHISGQERNSRMGRNNFPLAEAIKQIKWDNAGNMNMQQVNQAGLELHDYNYNPSAVDSDQGGNHQNVYHPINGDINGGYTRKQRQGQGQGQFGGNGHGGVMGRIHAQDLRTKVESDWIGHNHKRGGSGAGPNDLNARDSSNASVAIMRKGGKGMAYGHPLSHGDGMGKGSVAGSHHRGGHHEPGSMMLHPKNRHVGGHNHHRHGMKDELDNWMASKENNMGMGNQHESGKNGKQGSREKQLRQLGQGKAGLGLSHHHHLPPHYDHEEMRKKKERENHKLDRCLKFLVMGPIGPWSDNDDFMKNEFSDYVARSLAPSIMATPTQY